MSSGRRFAYVGVVVGLGVSVAANVAHAAAEGGTPWAMSMSGFWPLALFLALEILTRTRWAGGRGLLVARLGVAVVALVAAALSYDHLRGLLLTFGEAPWAATLGPLGVDGLMAAAAAALLSDTGRTGQHTAEDVPAPVVVEDVPAARVEATREPVPVVEAAAVEGRSSSPAPRGVPVARRAAAARSSSTAAATASTGKPAGGRVSDEQLLAAVTNSVASGELAPEEVTGNRLRASLGIGAERAGRIAAAWHDAHRGLVVPLHHRHHDGQPDDGDGVAVEVLAAAAGE